MTLTPNSNALQDGRVVVASEPGKDDRTLVSCGHGRLSQEIVIVDPDSSTPCDPEHVGEIWISGKNVAHGYWGKTRETKLAFQARLAGDGDRSYLRTGDLGFFYRGEIFVTGRLKDLIIINGTNHYPEDIERSVEKSHPLIRAGHCAAFSVDSTGQEQLIVIAELDRHRLAQAHKNTRISTKEITLETQSTPSFDSDSVIRDILRVVSENHDLSIHAISLIKQADLPKTSSGKIQRHACRDRFVDDTLDVIAQWRTNSPKRDEISFESGNDKTAHDIQDWIVSKVAQKLGKLPHEIDIRSPIASYGLDSLVMLELTGDLADWLGQSLLASLFWTNQKKDGTGSPPHLLAPQRLVRSCRPLAARSIPHRPR